jgi:hypothetical protein
VKQSTFVQTKYHFSPTLFNTIVDVSYRYMWDDWRIDSHTIDSRFHIPVGKSNYIQPHFRFYQQSAAEFYRPFVNAADIKNEQVPIAFVSADYRVGEMAAFTVGAKYGVILDGGNELSFRIEYYRQVPENAGFEEQGALTDVDIYPVVEAVIAQVSYSF